MHPWVGEEKGDLEFIGYVDTEVRAYSIAKVFTALETVRLAEDGLIALDDPIANLLPEWLDLRRRHDSAPVTVRHLLSHRGGLIGANRLPCT